MRRGALLALLAATLLAGAAGFALVAVGSGPATDVAPQPPSRAARPATATPSPVPLSPTTSPRAPRPRAAPPVPAAGNSSASDPPAAARPATRTISGRVRTAAGEPVAGAIVRVYGARGILVSATRSGEDGAFVAPDVPAEKVVVRVEPTARNGRASLGAQVAVGEKDADAVEVVAPGAAVAAGRVVGADGSAVPDADVWVYAKDAAPAWTRTDAAGRFEVAVPVGVAASMVVDPTTRGVSGRRWALGFHEVPPGGESGVEVRCAEGKRLEGRVVDGAGKPLANVRLRFTTHYSSRPTFATSRDDGSITCGGLTDVYPCDVAVDPDDKARAALILAPVVVRPGATEPVTFALCEPATARGRVVDATGAPLANWKITLTATDGGMERLVRTDAEGRFVAERLAPGRYKVRVTWVPFREPERTHVVGEVETGPAEAQLYFPETIAR
ncbi:MAG: carboxypeptidase-like regulatory domain-containing protein [Planctomycetes bacterium]|nr:carboxypeptidase-like regulatory domain-containing protein [Planctomycetota bacterium]